MRVPMIVIALLLAMFCAFAQEGATATFGEPIGAPKNTIIFAQAKYVSQYLASNGSVFHLDPCQQGFVGVQYKDLYLEGWGSYSHTGGFGREFDFTAEWTALKPSEKFPAKLTAGVLYIRANVDPVTGMDADLLQPSLKLAMGDFYVKAKYIFALNGGRNPEPGTFLEIAYAHVFPVSQKIAFEAKATLEHDFQGAFGFGSGTIGQIKPTALFHLMSSTDVFVSWTGSKVWGDPMRGSESAWSAGVSFTL